MSRTLAVSCFVLLLTAATAAAQPSGKAPATYDPGAERSYGGIVAGVISVPLADGTVSVDVDLKIATGTIVNVHLGPAMFIGMSNFYFLMDDQIAVKGAYITRGGKTVFWAREVYKNGKTLALRGPDGAPRWPAATADERH